MLMGGVSDRLSSFVADLTYEDLPKVTVERCKRLILDTFGIIIRARHDAESTESLISSVDQLEMNRGSCVVLGDPDSYSPAAAALINGTLAHSLDFDDTHAEASLHSSAPILPAALAAGQMVEASGQDLIAATVAGFEVQIRLSLALGPSDHYERGFHPTATCGVFGAAAAAGKLLGMDAEGIRNAFGIALSQAAGSLEFLADGAWTKRSHVGQAAQNGLICAVLANEGFRGVQRPFEGKAGFFAAYAPNSMPEKALEGLGQEWETLRLAVKPYPSCRYSHAGIDALLALREEHDIREHDIEEVRIGVSQTGILLIGEPEHRKQQPENVVDGQFSMPFCAAVALREGSFKWDDYSLHLNDEKTLDLCKKVRTVHDPRAEAEFPRNMSGVAEIKTSYGQFEKLIVVPKGEPENFLSDAEFHTKFEGLCKPYLGIEGAGQLANSILMLETANSIQSIMSMSQVLELSSTE